MITLLKWVGAAGAGAVFMLIVFYYTTHNQQKQEIKIDVQTLKTEKMYKDFANDPFFTPDKEDRKRLKEESKELATKIDNKQKNIEIRQAEDDSFVSDANKALKDMNKELEKKTDNGKKLVIKKD